MNEIIAILLVTLAGNSASKEVLPFVDTFVRYSVQYNTEPDRRVTLYFVPKLVEPRIAECDFSNGHIRISRPKWDKLSAAGKEQVVFHELGHCVLGYIEHEELGIMVEEHMSDEEYLANREKYIELLFKEKP